MFFSFLIFKICEHDIKGQLHTNAHSVTDTNVHLLKIDTKLM